MPVYSKKQLRRDLSAQFIHDSLDTIPWTSELAGAPYGSTVQIRALRFADTEASGQGLYKGAWLFLESSVATPDASATWDQYLVATFNVANGAFTSGQPARSAYANDAEFEIHTRVAPLDKNVAIDETIVRMRVRQEVGLTTIDGAMFYTIDGAASPFTIDRILDVHLSANPSGSQNQDIRHIQDWQVVSTATGNQLRIRYAVAGSQQLWMDCILTPTLGGELATLNIPDERWILAGAAARCYDFMIQAAPAQQVTQLMQRRAEYAAEYSRLSTRFQPSYDQPVRLHDVVRGLTGQPWSEQPW